MSLDFGFVTGALMGKNVGVGIELRSVKNVKNVGAKETIVQLVDKRRTTRSLPYCCLPVNASTFTSCVLDFCGRRTGG